MNQTNGSGPSDVPHVMLTNVLDSVMFSGSVSNEEHIMPPHFFQQDLPLNAAGYPEVLETAVNPWIDLVYD